MPTLDHAVMVELFRRCPDLGPRLLRRPLGLRLPRYARVEAVEAALDAPDGEEYRADLVLRLLDRAGRVKLAVVLEVQRGRDNRKRYTWPVYLAVLRRRLKAPTMLFVLTPSDPVAQWARKAVLLGGTGILLPWVIGPVETPRVTSFATARREPELTILSARMYGAASDGEPVLRAALEALTVVDPEMLKVYTRFINDTLPRDRPTYWKGPAMLRDEFKNVTLPKHFQQWVDLGEARGEARGKTEGKAEALLAILDARNLGPDESTRAQILACTQSDTLDRWIARAATATILDTVFAEG